MTSLRKLKEVFEFIDENYGCGPSEEITDENKVNEYIQNFISEFEHYGIFKELSAINESTSKSPMEMLNEL